MAVVLGSCQNSLIAHKFWKVLAPLIVLEQLSTMLESKGTHNCGSLCRSHRNPLCPAALCKGKIYLLPVMHCKEANCMASGICSVVLSAITAAMDNDNKFLLV
jgi:hypothetical protein